MRINILLACVECKRSNYSQAQKNKKNTTSKLELSKFCPFCGGHRKHRESK
jgi:large subunit ribosomal protein L33